MTVTRRHAPLSCDQRGDANRRGRLQGNYAASPRAIGDKLYCVSEEGKTTIAQGGVAAKILATKPLPDTFLAGPVAIDGALLLRSDKHLYCVGKKK